MRIWLSAILIALLAIAGGWLWLLNQAPVTVQLLPERAVSAPLGAALLAAAAAGAAVIGLLATAGALVGALHAWRVRRAARAAARRAASTARAGTLVWGGAYAQARAELTRRRDATDVDATRVGLLAEAHLREGDARLARRVIEDAAPRLAPDARLLDLLASAAEALGDRPAATAALERARRIDPSSPRFLRRLRDAYLAERRWAEALPLETELLLAARSPEALTAERAVLHGIQYELACAEADDARAARRLAALAREAPEFVPAWVSAGDRWAKAGSAWRARRLWRRGAVVRPDVVLLERLRVHDAAAGRPERTQRLYRDLRVLHPDDPGLALHEVVCLLACEQWDAAARALDTLPAAAEGPAAEALRGELHRGRGDAAAAAEAFARALGPDLGLGGPAICAACGAVTERWEAYCAACRRWSTIRVSHVRRMAPALMPHQVP